ncbi:MAG TPA: FAD-dependent monooxygenase [Umezawaea sp.]|nr:FAD-dependent monooxygenase [Umezawaea sp.]
MTDVAIVGGGPSGLLLATELALAGVSPVVLERRTGPSTELRANGLVGLVVEALDRRGLRSRITGSDEHPVPMSTFAFGAIPLDMRTLPTNALHSLQVPQAHLEEVIEARARELGVEIRRGHAITGLRQDSGSVTLDVDGPEGRYSLTANYVAAADGSRSTVRKLLGIGFPGITDERFVSRTGQVVVPAPIGNAETGELEVPGVGLLRSQSFTRTETGMFSFVMSRPGVWRLGAWEWEGHGDGGEITLADLRAAVHRVIGTAIPMEPPSDGPLNLRLLVGANSRIAERYRERRVFLLGDAAHVQSALGGPGLNLGLQDALNLGWKLAATVRGWAPAGLLDTYEAERRPVAQRVIEHSRAQLALLAPGPEVTALRGVLAELLRDDTAVQRVSDRMSGAEIDYIPDDDTHPLIGRWLPDLPLRTAGVATRAAEVLRRARPLLLDLTGRGDLAAVAETWGGRVDVVRADTDEPRADAVLVRPDGFVAWAGGDPDALRAALARWFGSPTRALHAA